MQWLTNGTCDPPNQCQECADNTGLLQPFIAVELLQAGAGTSACRLQFTSPDRVS